jgi:hypothetical protein
LPQAHVVPAFDHFADVDFVGIAYVCMSHRFALLQCIWVPSPPPTTLAQPAEMYANDIR